MPLQMITRGIRCYAPNCQSRMHHHCYSRYKVGSHNCPRCATNWSSEANAKKLVPIGEGAFRDGQDLGRRRARRTPEEDEDDGIAEEEYIDEEASQPSQMQEKKGKKKAVVPEDMEVDEDKDDDASPPPRTQRSRRGAR